MPTSHFYQLPQILELILFTDPKTILDIGVGFGKYGFLSREYLELWDDSHEYTKWQRRIDGIEVFEKYITPVHSFVYDKIYTGNALKVLPNLERCYDLVLLIDVLEHFDYAQGLAILQKIQVIGRNIIVSTPKDIGQREKFFENPFESHRFQWEKVHFKQIDKICFFRSKYSLVCYIGENAPRLRKAKFNKKIERCLPFVVSFIKRIKLLRDRGNK